MERNELEESSYRHHHPSYYWIGASYSVIHSYPSSYESRTLIGLLLDTQNRRLRKRRECRERFPRQRLQKKTTS